MLPNCWTERAAAELGVSTITTTIDIVIMRSIDAGFKTLAAKAFAAKQLFTKPFLDGGLITSLMLQLVVNIGNFAVLGIRAFVCNLRNHLSRPD